MWLVQGDNSWFAALSMYPRQLFPHYGELLSGLSLSLMSEKKDCTRYRPCYHARVLSAALSCGTTQTRICMLCVCVPWGQNATHYIPLVKNCGFGWRESEDGRTLYMPKTRSERRQWKKNESLEYAKASGWKFIILESHCSVITTLKNGSSFAYKT